MKFRFHSPLSVACLLISVFGAFSSANAQFFNDIDLDPHNYRKRVGKDTMSVLIEKEKKGDHDFGTKRGLQGLKKLLADLNIPISSQVLLFSKTSLQRDLVSPQNPRAIYFNEDIDVAWMPGGKIEVTAFDAEAGGLFYIEKLPQNGSSRLNFERPGSCLGCHTGSATNYLPGALARSNFTSETGKRLRSVPSHEHIGHQIPFDERWGGFFVTNAPATFNHMGNAFTVPEGGQLTLDRVTHAVKTDLSEFFDPSIHLRADSDVVNLMLFDHQVEMHNLLIEARYRERVVHYQAERKNDEMYSSESKDADQFTEKVVRYLLFANEVPLTGHVISRNPDFEKDFFANKRTDAAGNSLKDFDLKNHLFKNRCSYMIYSKSFENAPKSMKDRIYKRLWEVLTGKTPEGFDHFEDGEAERIVSILRATKNDLPAYWNATVAVKEAE